MTTPARGVRPGAKSPGAKSQSRKGPKRKQAAKPFRLSLIDAVTIAAAGLLVLKVGALLVDLPSATPFEHGAAQARHDYLDPVTTGSVTPKAEPAKPVEPPVYQPTTPEPVSPTERALLEKLAARREALKQRQDLLDQREQVLEAAERKLESGTADLKSAEDKVDTQGRKKGETEKAGLKSLVTMYETMKPKDAARVFDRLGHDVLVPIVQAMNPRKMAEILAVMGAEPAERLTVALAQRARGVETASATPAPGLPAGELPAIEPGPGRTP